MIKVPVESLFGRRIASAICGALAVPRYGAYCWLEHFRDTPALVSCGMVYRTRIPYVWCVHRCVEVMGVPKLYIAIGRGRLWTYGMIGSGLYNGGG